nr:cytochrome c-type biogenesis protein [Thaumasiovibrio subtropicus]
MCVAVFVMWLGHPLAWANIDAYTFESVDQERTFHELNKTLRCPKCQNNSIGDSNAELAKDLRQKVYEMLQEGQSEDEIVDYMVARYGNFVTYEPPLTPATLILWLAPALAILIGVASVLYRSRGSRLAAAEIAEEEKQRLERLLKDTDEDSAP